MKLTLNSGISFVKIDSGETVNNGKSTSSDHPSQSNVKFAK